MVAVWELQFLSIILASLIIGQVAVVDASIPRSSHGSTALHPPHQQHSGNTAQRPAWNASPKINEQGYLYEELYRRIPGEWEADCPHTSGGACTDGQQSQELEAPVIIRQVPGDGDCLFHAVAISLSLNLKFGKHLPMNSMESLWQLKDMSRKLRQMAVECLRSCNDSNQSKKQLFAVRKRRREGHPDKRKARRYKRLFIQGCESMPTSQLLSTAASQYGISPEEYCDLMEKDSYWGGGPEIVALCNVLKRPIHVYELVAASNDSANDYMSRDSYGKIQVPDQFMNKQFCLRRMATFGSPKYDSKAPLHILSADSRFPDVQPKYIRENGNHFMAIFPIDIMRKWVNGTAEIERTNDCKQFDSERKRRVRGGAAANIIDNSLYANLPSEGDVDDDIWMFNGEWFNDFKFTSPLAGKYPWDMDDEPSMRMSTNRWYRKLLRLPQKDEHHGKQNRLITKSPLQIEYWINFFVWTLAHLHIAF